MPVTTSPPSKASCDAVSTAKWSFGGREVVQENFKLVLLAITVISVMPVGVEFVRARRAAKRGESPLLELATVGEMKPENAKGGGRDGSDLAGTLAAIALAVIDGSRTARAHVPSQRRRRIPSGGAADKKRSASIKP
jgi:hypothetical protein